MAYGREDRAGVVDISEALRVINRKGRPGVLHVTKVHSLDSMKYGRACISLNRLLATLVC
jgi:hypothetical protein